MYQLADNASYMNIEKKENMSQNFTNKPVRLVHLTINVVYL